MPFSAIDQIFQQKKSFFFFRTKLIWLRSGSGSGLGLGLELASKVLINWAFFEMFFLVTLEPHVGHTKFPDFYFFTLS